MTNEGEPDMRYLLLCVVVGSILCGCDSSGVPAPPELPQLVELALPEPTDTLQSGEAFILRGKMIDDASQIRIEVVSEAAVYLDTLLADPRGSRIGAFNEEYLLRTGHSSGTEVARLRLSWNQGGTFVERFVFVATQEM